MNVLFCWNIAYVDYCNAMAICDYTLGYITLWVFNVV